MKLRDTDLRALAMILSRAAVTLSHPCDHGRPGSTIGEYVARATRDGQPGIKAATYDGTPAPATPATSTGLPVGQHPSSTDHDELNRLVRGLQRDSDDLLRILSNWRPDRETELDELVDIDEWCSHCLTTIGTCEPRFRGSLCRWCYSFQRDRKSKHHPAGWLPPAPILEHRHRGGRVTEAMIAQHEPPRRRKKRTRARR